MLDQTQKTTYSTGELARACEVSVRTVQYYDQKGLLPHSDLTEGGRRVYTQDDLAKLRKIMLLKSLGLQLSAIRGVLESEASNQVLIDVLREQDRKLEGEVAERQRSRTAIAYMLRGLETTGELPAETISDMDTIMSKRKWYEGELREVYITMFVLGGLISIAEWGTIVYGIVTGVWLPLIIALPFIVVGLALLVRFYHGRVAYVCPHCHKVFLPGTREWFFAFHTPTTRKVTCTHCGTKDWCAEVSSDRLVQEG